MLTRALPQVRSQPFASRAQQLRYHAGLRNLSFYLFYRGRSAIYRDGRRSLVKRPAEASGCMGWT